MKTELAGITTQSIAQIKKKIETLLILKTDLNVARLIFHRNVMSSILSSAL